MHQYKVDSGSYTSVAAARTIVQWVTGSTRRAKILEIGVSFASVTATDAPVLVELGTETSAGTSSSATIALVDQADPAAIGTALNNFSSTEPTGFTSVSSGPWFVTPIGGTLVYQFPAGQELVMAVSTRIAIRVTPGASLSTAIRGYIIVQE
jgi:hypothetical protein